MKIRTFVVLLLLVSREEIVAQVRAVVAIGSSTTYGMSADPPDSAWVRRLHLFLRANGSFDSVYNLGVPGKDCYFGMPDEFVPPDDRPIPGKGKNVSEGLRILNQLPDPSQGVIIISYASNNYHLYSIEEILVCLQTIYDETVSSGYLCLISTTQPRHDKYFDTGPARRKLAVIKDSIINRFGDASINFYDGFFNPADSSILDVYAAGDKVHYNNAGHRELFHRVRTKIQNITTIFPALTETLFYPNPVEDRLRIDAENFLHKSAISVFDLHGRVVWTGDAKDEYIDMSQLPPAIYLVKWIGTQGYRHQRILKK